MKDRIPDGRAPFGSEAIIWIAIVVILIYLFAQATSADALQSPFQPNDDHSGPIPTEYHGQLTQAEMEVLIATYFEPEWHYWALNVSKCESNWKTDAKRRGGTDSGLFQFIRSTWDWVAGETGTPNHASGAPFDAHMNTLNAAWLVENGGPSHWVCKSAKRPEVVYTAYLVVNFSQINIPI